MNTLFLFLFFFFFTAVFTLSHSHRVTHRGINGCVQLSGVKQVVKGSYMIPFQQGLNLWGCSPDCRLPASPLSPSNGTNYPATWVKQGNIHFRKERSKERKHLDSAGCCLPFLEAIRTNSVPGLSERSPLTLTFQPSHILAPPASALVPTLVFCHRTDTEGERREKDTRYNRKREFFGEVKENK